jgi:transglutaminase-like putative cysteine protease
MKIAIRHQLSLAIGPGAARAVQHILLTPTAGPTQSILEWAIEVPGGENATTFADGFGNRAMLVTQMRPEAEITISVTGLVETIDRNGVVGRPAGEPPPALFRRSTAATKPIGAITSKLRSTPRGGPDRIPLLHALMARVGEVLGETGQSQSQQQDGQSQSQSQGQPESQAHGSVRADATAHAHAFIGAARALDIPARFVTGYLYGAETPEAAFHAWAEAWDDGLGWIGFDAMLQICPTDAHVRVAVGLDANSTAPVRSVPVVGTPTMLEVQVEAAQ